MGARRRRSSRLNPASTSKADGDPDVPEPPEELPPSPPVGPASGIGAVAESTRSTHANKVDVVATGIGRIRRLVGHHLDQRQRAVIALDVGQGEIEAEGAMLDPISDDQAAGAGVGLAGQVLGRVVRRGAAPVGPVLTGGISKVSPFCGNETRNQPGWTTYSSQTRWSGEPGR